MMLQYFQDLAAGLEARLAEPGDGPVARKRFVLEIAKLGARLYTPSEQVAWCGVMVPFDLLNAMGVTSCFVEFVGGMLASTGTADPMLEAAEQAGFATDTCAYHRAVAGAQAQGLMPEPDLLIATTAPCTGGLSTIEHLARMFGKDLFVVQIPNGRDESAVNHLAEQFRDLVEFVSAHIGRQMDPGRLREAVAYTNQARDLWTEVTALASAVPSPVRRRDLVNFGILLALFLGTESAVEITRTYRDEYARKVASGVSGVAEERVRLMWLQNRIQFDNPLERMLEELGAAVVVDELNEVEWEPIDPDDPFRGMARRALSTPLCGGVDQRIANLQRLAKAFSVDGAINPCHWGCRQGTGTRGLIEQGLRQVGVPVQNLEVDCVDPRQFAEGQLRTRLTAFIEMLQTQRHSANDA